MDQNETELNASGLYDLCPTENESRLEVWIKAMLYVVTMLASLVGNYLVLWFVRRTRHQTTSNVFVANLSVADLVTTLLTMPAKVAEIFTLTDVGFGGWSGHLVCKLLYFFQDLSLYCSILTLVAIAFDRFFAIVLPLKQVITMNRARHINVAIWFAAFVTSAPLLYANKVFTLDEVWFFCVEDWSPFFNSLTAARNYTVVLFTLLYAAPLLLITALYSSVVYKLWKRKIPGNVSRLGMRLQARARHRALRMSSAIIICFAFSWLPYHVVSFLADFDPSYYECGLPNSLWFVGTFLGHFNSAVNPCIYAAFNKEYRDGIRSALRICCRGNRVDHFSSTTNLSRENIGMTSTASRAYVQRKHKQDRVFPS